MERRAVRDRVKVKLYQEKTIASEDKGKKCRTCFKGSGQMLLIKIGAWQPFQSLNLPSVTSIMELAYRKII